jgi:hypothetical protein
MIFQRVNRSDAEKVFTIQQNVAGSSIAANVGVVWDTSTSADGVRVKLPLASTLSCLVGVTVAAIADSAYGLVQTYGFKTSANVLQCDTAIVAGDILIPIAATGTFGRSGAADGLTGFVTAAYALATAATATTTMKVFIRCLASVVTLTDCVVDRPYALAI